MEIKIQIFKKFFLRHVQCEVPFFQRGYVWNISQWRRLFQDLEERIKISEEDPAGPSEHFFGTIILKKRKAQPGFIIIDGHQRLVTCYVLLIQLYRKLRDLNEFETAQELLKYLTNNSDSQENEYNKLKIISAKGETLPIFRLLYDRNPILPNGRYLKREKELEQLTGRRINKYANHCNNQIEVYTNDYPEEYVIEKISKLKRAILQSLQFVCIYLPENFNEQVIFETLNAEGVELTSSELLCNYIFDKIELPEEEERDQMHLEKWLRPQCNLENIRRSARNTEEYSKFDSYLRYLFSIGRDKMLPRGRAVYYRFKKDYEKSDQVQEQLNKIAHKIEYFKYYINPNDIRGEFNLAIQNHVQTIADLGNHSIIPFIMEFLEFFKKKPEDILEKGEAVLTIIITMLVRQKISQNRPSYDGLFPKLFQTISLHGNLRNTWRENLRNTIKNSRFFISDDKFKRYLKNNPINPNFLRYLLENINTRMTGNSENINYDNYPIIEHICPIGILNARWREHLGEEFNYADFATLRETIGNLTILSNQVPEGQFIEDKIQSGAYTNRPLTLTLNVINTYGRTGEWKLDTIRKRSLALAEFACQIWSWGDEN